MQHKLHKKAKRPRVAGVATYEELKRLAGHGTAGNSFDFRAGDAHVSQFTARHASEFVDGLTVLAPIVEGACYVHFLRLSEVFVTSAT